MTGYVESTVGAQRRLISAWYGCIHDGPSERARRGKSFSGKDVYPKGTSAEERLKSEIIQEAMAPRYPLEG